MDEVNCDHSKFLFLTKVELAAKSHLLSALAAFVGVTLCAAFNPAVHADSLRVENSGTLELTGVRGAVSLTRTRGGYVFLQSATYALWTDVSSNGFGQIRRLPLYWPITPLPDGGFAGVVDTNHIVTKCDAQGYDPTFSAPAYELGVGLMDLAAQPDGKIVIASSRGINPPGDYQGSGLFRLNADGSHDQTFQVSNLVLGRKVLVQPGGRILVLTLRSVLGFLPDGSVDPSFEVSGFDNDCSDFGLQPDGSIVVAGRFSTVDGVNRPNLARLTPLGHPDLSFGPVSEVFSNGLVGYLALQSNGDIVIQSLTAHRVRRYFKDGRMDRGFMPPDSPESVVGLGIDASDKIIFNFGDNMTFVQYSGRQRFQSSGSQVDQILEQSTILGSGASWTAIKPIPANTIMEFPLPDQPGPGNAFFRLRSAQ